MIVLAGNTAHFTVSYDDAYPYTKALANDVLARCEADLTSLANIFVGVPVPASMQVTVTDGGGGAIHFGTNITLHSNMNTTSVGITGLLVAEVDEIFMSEQMATLGKGFNPGYSHGEGLSRVLAQELYSAEAGLFSSGYPWMNSPRKDWVTMPEPTDGDQDSYGCSAIFLSYLHFQLGFTWQQIVAAADNTLALVAQNLGVQNAWNDFYAVLARHYPVGVNLMNYPWPKDSLGIRIDNLFPLSCLYMRHNLADDGTSHTGTLSVSPDIIVKNNAVANPQATYSTPASIASDQESDANVNDMQDNYVYLRVWNLGADATNVTATVYWSQVATLVTPAMWNQIGQAPFADVPAGRVVEVSVPGLTWAKASIPAPGHYCFVATVGNAGDPAPAPGNFASFNDYMAYIEANNNITWRNFNVVAARQWTPSPRFPGFVEFPFLITGAWDEARRFGLEVHADLPGGSRLALHVPALVAGRLEPAPHGIEEHEDDDADPDDRRRARVPLNPHGAASLGHLELEAGAAVRSQMLVHVPDGHLSAEHRIVIRQTHDGHDVGGITWLLVP